MVMADLFWSSRILSLAVDLDIVCAAAAERAAVEALALARHHATPSSSIVLVPAVTAGCKWSLSSPNVGVFEVGHGSSHVALSRPWPKRPPGLSSFLFSQFAVVPKDNHPCLDGAALTGWQVTGGHGK